MKVKKKILVAQNQKGGVGKTSLTCNVGGIAAASGLRVLVIDLDPQGNTRRDFGMAKHDGSAMVEALVERRSLPIVKNVRERLDVVPGGKQLSKLIAHDFIWKTSTFEPTFTDRLEAAIDEVADDYDLIIIDTPPGDQTLTIGALLVASDVVVPTRVDEGSLDGVEGVADLFVAAHKRSPDLRLCGVVIFGSNTRAQRVNRDVQEALGIMIAGAAPVFRHQIPDMLTPSVDARRNGLLIHELQPAIKEQKRLRLKALREGTIGNMPEELYTRDAERLADAYQGLTAEILTRMELMEEAA